jgi:two-component sensor histidine kinase
MPLTLILAEWFTNSSKYGACSVNGGQLRIAWTITDPAPPNPQSPAAPPRGIPRGIAQDTPRVSPANRPHLTLTWTEQNGPEIRNSIIPSLGTSLVQGFATQELQGECELRYPPEGANHTLRFPLPSDSLDTPNNVH